MARIRGERISFTGAMTDEALPEWAKLRGYAQILEDYRNMVTDLDGRKGVDQEQLRRASDLIDQADQLWQKIKQVKRVLETSIELAGNEQWLKKVAAKPALKKSLSIILMDESFSQYSKWPAKLFELQKAAFEILCTEAREVGLKKGFAMEALEETARACGAKGGSARKRKGWAELTAAKLREEAQGCTEDEAWGLLPGSRYPDKELEPWEFELDGEFDVEVYQDGDKLVAVNPATKAPIGKGELKKSTFFKEYYRKAIKGGK